MKTSAKHLFFAALLGVVLLPASRSYGIPAFARRYQMECTMCHEPVPRLNEFGYKFRAAGFRLPEEIGKGEASSDYSNYIAARIVLVGSDASTKVSDNNTASTNQAGQLNIVNFSAASIYPLCGAFGGHVSAWSELGYSPGLGGVGKVNMGNAFIRLTYGDTSSFWSVRVGLFSAIEGYGASDAGISPSGNLLKSAGKTIIGGKLANALYTPGTGEAGIHFSWDMDRLSLQAAVFNGGLANGTSFQAAIGSGTIGKPANSPSYNSKDFMLFASYILDEHGGGVQGYFFTGSIDYPNPVASLANNAAAMFPDNYMRYGLYATSPTFSGFKLLAGVSMGSDKEWESQKDSVAYAYRGRVADSTAASMGWFVEPDFRLDKSWSFGARYDFFDPFTGSNYQNNEISAKSVFVNYCMNNGLTFYAELIDKTTLQGMDATASPAVMKKDDYAVNLRTFFIW